MVEFRKEHRQYMGISWKFSSGERVFFQYAAMAFGFRLAPLFLTKIMRTLVTRWRSRGFPMVLFIDDGVGIFDTKRRAADASEQVREQSQRAGLVKQTKERAGSQHVD